VIISETQAANGAFPIIDVSRESAETVAPFMTIVGARYYFQIFQEKKAKDEHPLTRDNSK
jgi:hypothetical protein